LEHLFDDPAGKRGSDVERAVLVVLQRYGDAGDSEERPFDRGCHRAGIENIDAGIQPIVDAADDQIGTLRAELEDADLHAVSRAALDRPTAAPRAIVDFLDDERRKKRAEFLRHLGRKLNLNMDVYDADINDLSHLGIDVCVARAVTNIEGLLLMCSRHVNAGAMAVFPVPREQAVVDVEGWHIEAVHDVDAVESQQIQCYRWEGVST